MARCALGLGSFGRIHRRIGIKPDEDIQLPIEPADALQQCIHQLDWREFSSGDGPRRLRRRQPVQVVHSPVPTRIGSHGSARGSVGTFIFATASLACLAAAATSSGNCASALSSPARRASSSTVLFSMVMALSIRFPMDPWQPLRPNARKRYSVASITLGPLLALLHANIPFG